jgi:hypothetical protein
MSDDLIFREEIHGTDHGANDFECFIWAGKGPKEHWQFKIGRTILEIFGKPSIVAKNNVDICNANRPQIFAACKVAYNEQPDKGAVDLQRVVDLLPHHFR